MADKKINQVVVKGDVYDIVDEQAARKDELPEGQIDLTLTSTSISDGTTTLDISGKVDAVTTANKIYGTDSSGAQTTYDKDSWTDENIKLAEDLSVYTNVGLITTASSTNPVLVGNAGDSIKDVFNTLFVGSDMNPVVTIPTLSIELKDAKAGYTYTLVKGEIIEPKFTATYSNVDGSYQYGSVENRLSTSTCVTVNNSTFTAGTAAITGTISNTNKTQELTGSSYTVKTTGGQSVTGTVNFNLTNVRKARTKLGKQATVAASGSTGTLDSSTGKLSSTKVSYSKTIGITSANALSVIKPSISIGSKTDFPTSNSYIEIGTSYTPSFEITKYNETGKYPYGYWDGTTKQTSTDAGCSAGSLTVTLNDGTATTASYDVAISFPAYETVYGNNSNKFYASASGVFNCTLDREPLSQNNNKIDTSVGDYRISGSSISYTANTSITGTSYYGYVPAYYGFKYSGSIITNPANITPEEIKALGNSVTGSDAYSGHRPTDFEATSSWRQLFVAIPVDNGWGSAKTPTAKDGNGLVLTVSSVGNKSITFGSTAVTYNVYYINQAADYDTKDVEFTW